MRGVVTLPGSKATSRAKGSHRKLGDLVSGRYVLSTSVRHREGEEPKPMMHGYELPGTGSKLDVALAALLALLGCALVFYLSHAFVAAA
jgi:hypothetical protein